MIVHFNPRTPGGVRLDIDIADEDSLYISIHAPRVGCDGGCTNIGGFQSTHPGWGATAKVHKRRNGFYVLLRIFFHLCIKTIIFGAMLVCKPGKNLA